MGRPPIQKEPGIPLELREEALRKVLRSQTFSRAEKAQRFLKFVAELTFRGEASAIHEHLIAMEVFERGDDYSSGEDSVVRRQAHALRRKLKDYYEGEGRSDEIQIELPLGSYVPVFSRPWERTTAQPARRRAPRWTVAAACLGGVALFAAGWWTGSGWRHESVSEVREADPSVRGIWASWLEPGAGEVLLCYSSPPTTSVRQFKEPLQPNPEHQGLGVTAAQDTALRRFFQFPPGGHLYLYPLAAQAKMGEALAGVHLTSFFARAGVEVRAVQSRDIGWDAMRRANVILFGHADSNRWIEPALHAAPFGLAQTDARRRARIVNRRPLPGEAAEYFPTVPDGTKSYALVSMLAGLDGSHEILVLGGLDTSSTTAATEYLLTREPARDLLRRLRQAAPGRQGPWRFQVVLETDVRETVPLKAFPVALRVF